jgi:hypothetical protein
MILRFTSKTASLVGETPAECDLLEKQVRSGRRTTAPRAEDVKLQELAEELGVPLRLERVWCRGRGGAALPGNPMPMDRVLAPAHKPFRQEVPWTGS